jgi:hypothetical protein
VREKRTRSVVASRAVGFGKSVALSVLLTAIVLAWLAFFEGIFDSHEALDEQAAGLDGGALEQWPFVDGGVEDAGVQDAGVEDAGPGEAGTLDAGTDGGDGANRPSLGLGGIARLSASRLSIDDKKGRNVLRARNARAAINLGAMRRGAIRVPRGHLEGVEVTLYRDENGKISIANAFGGPQPTASSQESSEQSPESGSWVIGAGPIKLKDVILTLGFTAKPLQFRIDRGTLRVARGAADAGPVIYFDDIEGALLKPRPLPKPIRIAYAKGIVRLKGRPLVEMAARTCLGISELRIGAVVPARKQAVELTATSIGVSSLLGRVVLQSVAQIKPGKINYGWGLVKLKGGRKCVQPPTRDEDTSTR